MEAPPALSEKRFVARFFHQGSERPPLLQMGALSGLGVETFTASDLDSTCAMDRSAWSAEAHATRLWTTHSHRTAFT